MSYSNFKDPVGLLKRMLLSGNKTAYSILFREFFTKLVVPIDLLLRNSEKRKLKKSNDSTLPIILVLGGSRSGTTLLYQTLERYLSVSYISNFIASFVNSPITAFKLFHRLIPKSVKSYQSYFGSVQGFGGPNDAFFLWNRWLGEDRNHAPEDISEESKVEMRTFFNTWLNTTKKPFLNKNNRNSLCAPMFDKIFPNIFFVEIYRDPIFVAQSIILSRRTVQGSDKIGWGLLSKDFENNSDPLAYIDDICRQVFEVNRILAVNRAKIDPNKYFRVSYEDFCENPMDIIKLVGTQALDQTVDDTDLTNLKFSAASNGQRLTDEEFNRIKSCLKDLQNKKELAKK
ncbi:sulfotransferase [Maribacter algarum]|uniref:Sulfotransferase n=1 Tax=Maribacter algarum (ex Zhang et al. 2020) TaxID=2578118 RepID=A0A5S3PXY9_9FLAO|nr:sulfotransferase [Maribacter algarum]TMM59122.1 sulfotransferase [Maribacter algarum]